MRRALIILRYVPAMLCGLLVVAWVVSLIWVVFIHNVRIPLRTREAIQGFRVEDSSIVVVIDADFGEYYLR